MIPVVLERLNAAPSKAAGPYSNIQEMVQTTLKDHGINYDPLNTQVALHVAAVLNTSVMANLLPTEKAVQMRVLINECWTNYCAMILPSKIGVTLTKKAVVESVF